MKPHALNVPVRLAPKPEWGQVILRADSVSEAAEHLETWTSSGVVIRRIDLPWDEALPGFVEGLDFPVRVLVEVDNKQAQALKDLDREAAMQVGGTNLWAQPAPGSTDQVVDIVKTATTAGWPVLVRLERDFLRQPEPLLHILDHYLFHRDLKVPVEPLHSLLVAKVQVSGRLLWSVCFGQPADHFYADDEGHISLCEQWVMDPERRYGTTSDPVDGWRKSSGYELLGGWLRRSEPAKACVNCDHRSLCGGMLLALDDEADCEAFKELFDRIRLAAGVLQREVGRRRGGRGGRKGGPKSEADRKEREGESEY